MNMSVHRSNESGGPGVSISFIYVLLYSLRDQSTTRFNCDLADWPDCVRNHF